MERRPQHPTFGREAVSCSWFSWERVTFLLGYSNWYIVHVPEDGPTSMHTWAILAGLRGLVVMITKRMDDIKLGGRHGGTLEGVGERYSQLIKIYA